MDKKLHIGTSGWSYEHWKELFYPERISGDQMLGFYAKHFKTVEINTTFYRLPSKQTLKNWYQTVPDHFIFSVKASQYITHRKKLIDPKETTHNFFDRVQILDDKLGPILFQLPPRWHKNKNRLADFIRVLPTDYHYVFEFRDSTWFSDDITELLYKKNVTFCIYDLEGKQTPFHITNDLVYVRLHGPGAKYQGSYSKDLLETWTNRFRSWLDERHEIYCYFNNDYETYAPRNASLLLKLMGN